MKLGLKPAAWKAVAIGGLCSVAYLAVYVAKNILSAATPQITAAGAFTVERIGALSSTYYICYAIGQLINGYIGDKIKAKYMDGVLRLTLPKQEKRLPEGRRLEIE